MVEMGCKGACSSPATVMFALRVLVEECSEGHKELLCGFCGSGEI